MRRYRGSGLKLKAGLGGAGLAAAGLGVSFGPGGAVAGGGAMVSGLAGAMVFTMMAPAFGVAGIVRAVHNSQVNDEILRRQSDLPLNADAGVERSLDLFYPLAPSPRRIQIAYADSHGAHVLELDSRVALAVRGAAAFAYRPGLGDLPVGRGDDASGQPRLGAGYPSRQRQLDDRRPRHRVFRTHFGTPARARTALTWPADLGCLPRHFDETEPSFAHHGSASPSVVEGDGVCLTIVAGEAFGESSPVQVLSDTL